MKKVDLIFSKTIYGPTGDCTFVRTMAENKKMFAENGLELRVITPDLYSLGSQAYKSNNVTKKHLIASFFTKFSAVATLIYILRREKKANKVLSYYNTLEDKGDIVAFQELLLCYQYLKCYHDTKQRILLTFHSSGDFWAMWYYQLPRLKSCLLTRFRRNVENTIIEKVNKFGFVANFPRMEFCGQYQIGIEKTFYVYNGIEANQCPVRTKCDKVKLICVGTLCSRKNQMGILNAVGMLDAEYQNQIEIVLVGDGDERNNLEVKAKSLISPVSFTGRTNEVMKYLLTANIFCLFSKDEGLPISIIEAMRAALPIIGSKVAGIPEQIIEGETGFVVDLDERKLAKTLQFVVDNKSKLQEMGYASYQLFIKNFTSEAMVKKYARVYDSIPL